MPDEAGLITVAEASAWSGYSAQHLTRLIRQGKIAGKRYGPVWLTTIEAVEAYRRTDPKPGPKPGGASQ